MSDLIRFCQTLLNLAKLDEEPFFGSLDVATSKTVEPAALVFIHGYLVTFAEAIRRTAQIAYDLDFQGVPICYSWPSAGKFALYAADETSVDWTVPHLTEFLHRVATMEGVRVIHLVAHSMGNRALVNCLDKLAQQAAAGITMKARIKQAILAAPDIDAGVFRQLARSSADLALRVSQQFHRYPRAGESGPDLLVLPQIDTVDASSIPAGFLGHSYYGDSQRVLADVHELIKSGGAPPRFGLRPSGDQGKKFWIFVP